jgi:hypothetical protein
MIADKATSFPTSELLDSLTKHKHIGLSSSRTVIMQWFKHNFNDLSEFLSDIDQNGFHPDETVMGVHEKEREREN